MRAQVRARVPCLLGAVSRRAATDSGGGFPASLDGAACGVALRRRRGMCARRGVHVAEWDARRDARRRPRVAPPPFAPLDAATPLLPSPAFLPSSPVPCLSLPTA
ncbi:hypothetical protein AB1Y20_004407 [Prymnesium parvum]|uniref:Uncharacterized protein n=1 Tax=Prymnesium parvum TaxID=97485 RepID=A0AB34J066_PRYPA